MAVSMSTGAFSFARGVKARGRVLLLLPLAELGRPRIDVIMTLSGIFRDLLPLQTRMLAEAALKVNILASCLFANASCHGRTC